MRRVAVAIIALLLLGLALSVQAQITVGVNLSTTGPGASIGIPEKNVMAFAPPVIAGQKVRYIVYDDSSDSTVSLRNMKRLVTEDKVDLVIGPSITTSALGVIDTAAEYKTPMIALASASAIISPVDARRHWIFKAPANDIVYNGAMVRHMVKKGVKTVSIITLDDPYGEANTAAYKELADKAGIKTLTIEKFLRTDTSVTGQVLRVMQGNPDAVFVIGLGTTSALPHMTLVERGYKGKIYQTGTAVSADFLRLGGKLLEGSFVPTSPVVVAEQLPDGYPTKAEAMRFLHAYEPKFGPRAHFAALAWDALGIMKDAVPRALKTGAKPGTVEFREALRDAIEKTTFYGAAAVYKYSPTDHSGVGDLGMALVRVDNGQWKLEDYADFKKK